MKAVFNDADLEKMQSNKRMADNMLRGLEAGEFQPAYQPQIDVETGKVVALEVRGFWNHPSQGLVPMGSFQGTAREAQMDFKIDALVQRQAFEECRAYFACIPDPPALSLRASLPRLMDDDLLKDVTGSGYKGRIALGLSETIFLEEENSAVLDRLEALRALGVSIEVDNFGSGRASIFGLRRLAPDLLTVDARLVAPITTSPSARRLVGSLVEIGAALEIVVAAAGVETATHFEHIKKLRCVRAKGAHFAELGPLTDVCPLTQPNVRSG